MLSRAAALALVGSAAAFNPMMSMDVGRRQVLSCTRGAGHGRARITGRGGRISSLVRRRLAL
jgi:hypothetical protein